MMRFCSLFLLIFACHNCVIRAFSNERAPQINAANHKDQIAYKTGEPITLQCPAEGVPTPIITWKKNGMLLNMSGPNNHYSRSPGLGDLTIRSPQDEDDGDYNCLASNRLGVAVGMKMKVKKAVINPFQTRHEPQVKDPVVGDSLTISCTPPPVSYPKGSSYFGFNRPGSSKLENIPNDNRVLLDYDGNLYFANVFLNDSLSHIGPNVDYLCVVSNAFLGAYVQGNNHKVSPRVIPGSPTYRAPSLLWPSATSSVAVLGQTKLLKCIFGGLPTPNVTWRGEKTDRRFEYTPEGYGTEIRFNNIILEDEGVYTCSATNLLYQQPVSHQIRLTVQTPPIWNKKPVDLDVPEESDIEVNCQAHGMPNPRVTMFINGNQIHEYDFRGMKRLENYKLHYQNVSVNDSQVIQCLAENEHGVLLSNIILKVNAEEPSFLETPTDKKVVQGTTVQLKCNTRGAPKPKITWFRGNPGREVRPSGRVVIHDTGTLEIRYTDLDDTDRYRCVASNKHGDNDASAVLTVRLPTQVHSAPVDKVFRASQEVVLPCNVTTDRAEEANLVVEWYKNGERINFTREALHLYMDKRDHSLHIRQSVVKDTADYRCNATNGLDSVESGVSKVTVKDRPDPPYDVEIVRCDSTEVIIAWKAGNDNNDPINVFTVHYNTSYSTANATMERGSVGSFYPNYRYDLPIKVHPWTRYSFYVTATNNIGTSRPSSATGQDCMTPQVVPSRHPSGVCGKLLGPRQLAIVWEPMPEQDLNGEQFHYIVRYKRRHTHDEFHEQKVWDHKLGILPIHDQPTFTEFEIYVLAANKMGVCQERYAKHFTYSGEGKPQDAPQNFNITHLNRSYAGFVWDSVDTSQERVRGFFRGYQINFWKTIDPTVVLSEYVLVNQSFELCPFLGYEYMQPPPQRRRRNHDHEHTLYRQHGLEHNLHHRMIRALRTVHGSTNKLWSKSKVSAGVRVLSQQHASDLSNVIEFETPEGVPGRVAELKIIERGSSHLVIEWRIPVEPSGVIVGYQLEWVVAHPAVGQKVTTSVPNPRQTTFKIRGLEYSTRYQISVSAETSAGIGESHPIFGDTLPPIDPDVPVIGNVIRGDSSANVSWVPSGKRPPENPGSDFYVEYRVNKTVWQRVDPHGDNNWVNITDLEKGEYEIRVVATSGVNETIRETRSGVWIVTIGEGGGVITPGPGSESPLVYTTASAGWFIILMCIIGLLLLVLIILCILKRARGDMYPVYEKEKMWRHRPLAPDETPFGEYTPPSDNNPNVTRSRGSLDSDEKPVDSDSDSLGEYEDQDASKFNEDGSFIGQYTGKHKPNAASPTSINTSV